MKKKLLLTTLSVLIVLACTYFISDGMTYLVTSLMAITIVFGMKWRKKWMMKMTRWAKANPMTAQIYITFIHVLLLLLAITAGYNLDQLGYEFSNTTAYIFTAIMVLGFAYVPFLPKRSTIALPKNVEKNRFAFISIALSSAVLMAFTGNKIADVYPNSSVALTLEKVDQMIFGDDFSPSIEFEKSQIGKIESKNIQNYLAASSAKPLLAAVDIRPKDEVKKSSNPNPSTFEKTKKSKKEIRRLNKKARKKLRQLKKERKKNLRRAASGGACVGAVLLIILLVAPLCAGICLIVGAWGNTGVLSILGGVALTGLSIWGMIEAGKMCAKSTNDD